MEKSQDCFFRYVINAPFLCTEGNEFHVKIKGLCRHYFFECPLKGFVFPRMAASFSEKSRSCRSRTSAAYSFFACRVERRTMTSTYISKNEQSEQSAAH